MKVEPVKLDAIKIKACALQTTVSGMKREADWEKIFETNYLIKEQNTNAKNSKNSTTENKQPN